MNKELEQFIADKEEELKETKRKLDQELYDAGENVTLTGFHSNQLLSYKRSNN